MASKANHTFAAKKMGRSLFQIIVLLLSSLCVRAQFDPPAIRCIALDTNDDVVITWQTPDSVAANFFAYQIHYRPGGTGSYSVISTINDFDRISDTLLGSFAGSGSFFMTTLSSGGGVTSLPSDTVFPMIVTAVASGKSITIGWNQLDLPSPDSTYRLYRSIAGGAWTFLASIPFGAGTFTDVLSGYCEVQVRYQVEIDGLGCTSRSNVAAVIMQDDEPPQSTNIVCASVEPNTGAVTVNWQRSASPDVQGYLIYYFGDFNWIDTVFGPDQLSFTFSTNDINALLGTEMLSVAPFDSCYDSVSEWYNQSADDARIQTLFLDSIQFDLCAGTIALQWNTPTEEVPVGVLNTTSVHMLRSTNGGPYENMATFNATDSVFVDSTLLNGNEYTFLVSADDASGCTAFSNPFGISLKAPSVPENFGIVAIQNNHNTGLNEVTVHCDTNSSAAFFRLMKSSISESGFIEVSRVADPSIIRFKLTDSDGRADQQAFYYIVEALDACAEPFAQTALARSIHVDGSKLEKEYLNELRWTAYEGHEWMGTENRFHRLIRHSDKDTNLLVQSPTDFYFLDDIHNIPLVAGNLCYSVESTQDTGNLFGYYDTCISNLFCLDYNPKLFVPNAFSPDNDFLNDEFVPVLNFIEPAQYSMLIFDRTGGLIFQSNDPNLHWDGLGFAAGVYGYLLSVVNAYGDRVEQRGKVALVR